MATLKMSFLPQRYTSFGEMIIALLIFDPNIKDVLKEKNLRLRL